MQDTDRSLGGRLGEESDKKARGHDPTLVGQEEEETEADVEATSQGAAGNLTGAEDRACQEP